MTVNLKQYPELKRVILQGFPGYRKHSAFVHTFGGRVNISSYWDGGSKDYFSVVELQSGRSHPISGSSHPFYDIARHGMANQQSADGFVSSDHVGNVYLNELPEGFALVRSGTFRGKPGVATIYFNAADMPKQLTDGSF
jgi:hypothetical protein